MAQRLTAADYEAAARRLRCDLAAVYAVVEVESRGSGFLPSGKPKILFEAHHFHRFTRGHWQAARPSLSQPTWRAARRYYRGGEAEWRRFGAAWQLDKRAAILSTSFGLFQIMGFNFAQCGFATAEEFYAAMLESEAAHLRAFIAFAEAQRLDDELRRHDWRGFARGYNGEKYFEHQYDVRLARAWRKHTEKLRHASPVDGAAAEPWETAGIGAGAGESDGAVSVPSPRAVNPAAPAIPITVNSWRTRLEAALAAVGVAGSAAAAWLQTHWCALGLGAIVIAAIVVLYWQRSAHRHRLAMHAAELAARPDRYNVEYR